jgi:hypothetical protein
MQLKRPADRISSTQKRNNCAFKNIIQTRHPVGKIHPEISPGDIARVIVQVADDHSPAALHPDRPIRDEITGAAGGRICNFFETAASKEVERTFWDALSKSYPEGSWDGEMTVTALAYGWLKEWEQQAYAIGFAAGLRAAGVSKETAQMMVAGLLRNWAKT